MSCKGFFALYFMTVTFVCIMVLMVNSVLQLFSLKLTSVDLHITFRFTVSFPLKQLISHTNEVWS